MISTFFSIRPLFISAALITSRETISRLTEGRIRKIASKNSQPPFVTNRVHHAVFKLRFRSCPTLAPSRAVGRFLRMLFRAPYCCFESDTRYFGTSLDPVSRSRREKEYAEQFRVLRSGSVKASKEFARAPFRARLPDGFRSALCGFVCRRGRFLALS